MGGSALLIYGRVAEELLKERPRPRSLADRLLGRRPVAKPEWMQVGKSQRMIDLPADAFAPIGKAFREHVATRFQPRWTATESVIGYLDLGITEVYLRGDREGDGEPEWYVQVSFSGCAGMAEVSSELAAHWADRWFRSEGDRITENLLRPHGFEPNGRTQAIGSGEPFVPMGVAGYAIYHAEPREADPDLPMESRYFDIDFSAVDTLSEDERGDVMQKLDAELPPLLPRGPCCCQWCAPELDVTSIAQVVPFK